MSQIQLLNERPSLEAVNQIEDEKLKRICHNASTWISAVESVLQNKNFLDVEKCFSAIENILLNYPQFHETVPPETTLHHLLWAWRLFSADADDIPISALLKAEKVVPFTDETLELAHFLKHLNTVDCIHLLTHPTYEWNGKEYNLDWTMAYAIAQIFTMDSIRYNIGTDDDEQEQLDIWKEIVSVNVKDWLTVYDGLLAAYSKWFNIEQEPKQPSSLHLKVQGLKGENWEVFIPATINQFDFLCSEDVMFQDVSVYDDFDDCFFVKWNGIFEYFVQVNNNIVSYLCGTAWNDPDPEHKKIIADALQSVGLNIDELMY